MTPIDLQRFVTEQITDHKGRLMSSRLTPQWFERSGHSAYFDAILSATTFFPEGSNLTLRVKGIQNGITEQPKCLICSTPHTNLAHRDTKSKNYPFSDSCSHACQQKLNLQKRTETMMNRYGVDHYKKTIEGRHAQSVRAKALWSEPNSRIRQVSQKLRQDQLTNEQQKRLNGTKALTELLLENDRSVQKAARAIGVHYGTLIQRLRQFDIYHDASVVCKNVSMGEKEIFTFIQSEYTGNILSNVNDLIEGSRYEFDVVLPQAKLAIEYDGILWHSEAFGKKPRNYHLTKTELMEGIGYQLIHIFESEWLNKPHIIKSILRSKLGSSTLSKIHGRKCVIVELDSRTTSAFLNENHLQGSRGASVRLGLVYNRELVSVMTLGKPRYSRNHEWEIVRFANKVDHAVMGGASRLFQHFIKNYSPKSIITYADRRYSTGTLYETLGMNFVRNSNPNYFYWKDYRTLESRVKYTKKRLLQEAGHYHHHHYNNNKGTEWEIMQSLGYDRIWDCGNKVYEWRGHHV